MVLESSLTMQESDTVDVTSPPASATRQITKQITKEGKDALHNYFATCRCPRNTQIPKVNTDGMLDRIINKFNLKHSQASWQLRVWKDNKYCNVQVKITINPKDIELSIMEGFSMELDEYVVDFFATTHEG